MNIFKRAVLGAVYPVDCCDVIKRDTKKFNLLVSLVFYIIIALVNYSYLFYVHFPLSLRSVTDANILLEAVIIVIPHFSWVVASYAITAIMDGESTFMQQLEAATYSLTPMIVCIPVLGFASRVLSIGEAGIYNFLYFAVIIWVLVLMFISLMVLNDYTFPKALGVALISLIAMVIMWCVVLLLMSLTVQLFSFFQNLFKEFQFKQLS